MKGQPIFKFLKQRSWTLLITLGLLTLSSILVLSSQQPAPQKAIAVRPSAPATSPAPIASKTSSASSPSPAPAEQAKPANSAASPGTNNSGASNSGASNSGASNSKTDDPVAEAPVDPSALTPEQQAMNQQAKAAFESSLSSIDSLVEMRVAIAKAASSLSVSVSNTADLINQQGEHLGTLAPGQSYSVQASGQTILLDSQELPSLVWIEPGMGGVFTLGDRTYRGRLLISANESHLWGVNFVSMRQYLYSVVASEVSPNWPMEALKAQAVAARSYALTYYFRPVNSLYQLGDDEYFQVYSGIDREAEATNRAVDATAGEFVSYRGNVVESLYAASDDIVAEAFQGRGMSQLGALGLAEQGYTYHQILANYYPNTGVARIEQDYE